jgi:hypothetical protein
MATLTVSARAAGSREPLEPDWDVPWPPEAGAGGEPLTLRMLIARIVREEVEAFRQRQRRHRLVRVLTARQIETGIGAGRVASGGRDLDQPVDADAAVAAALQAFEDGLYLVILDAEEVRRLDQQVHLAPDSKLTFLRLTFLAGA